jgi:hypothetical protein
MSMVIYKIGFEAQYYEYGKNKSMEGELEGVWKIISNEEQSM